MEHVARTAANHLIPTPYGLQYNCGKFNQEYVSQSNSMKFQQDSQFFEYCRAYCLTFSSGFNTRIIVAKETSQRYAMPIDIPYKGYNEDLPKSDRFAGYLDVSTSCIGAICGLISSCHSNASADITNNQTQSIQLNFYSLHYGIMYIIASEYKQVRKCIYIYIDIYI